MKLMSSCLFFLLMSISLIADNICYDNEIIARISKKYHIDFYTRSLPSWIRVFNNPEKYKQYHITDKDRLIILRCITKLYIEEQINTYSK